MGNRYTRRQSLKKLASVGTAATLLTGAGSASAVPSGSEKRNGRGKGPEKRNGRGNGRALGRRTKEMFDRHGKPVGVHFFNSSKNHGQAKKSYEILFENTTQLVRVDNSQSTYEVELSGERFTLDRDKLEQIHQENMTNIKNRKKKAEDEYLSSVNEVVADKVRKSHRNSEGHSEEN